MKDELFNKHLEAIENKILVEVGKMDIGKSYAEIKLHKAAKASVEITLGYMKGFAEWCSMQGWTFVGKSGFSNSDRWFNDDAAKGLKITDKLIQEFLTSKK